MILQSDPRVFFAAERTLLAWLRTGLTVMVVGFVVARFGLFLRLLGQSTGVRTESLFSAALGVLFVLAGALLILVATLQHRRFIATLPMADLPGSYSGRFAVAVSAVIGMLGVVLAAYLAASSW
jgi:inner membrane protein YidH